MDAQRNAYEFDVFTDGDITQSEAEERLFELHEGDATPGVLAGEPFVTFHLEAESVGSAVDEALATLAELGLKARRLVFVESSVAPEGSLASV